jgi:hypothetical protein
MCSEEVDAIESPEGKHGSGNHFHKANKVAEVTCSGS